MRAIPWIIVCCGLALAPCAAQDTPAVELFGGYSYARADFTGAGQKNTNFNGWNASIAGNVNRWFGVVADFGGHYGSSTVQLPVPVGTCPPLCLPPISVGSTAHEFLFGPRLSYRTEKLTTFAHVLVGGTHVSASVGLPLPVPTPPISITASQTGFAAALGGGFDFSLSKRIAWRTQTDYLMTRLFGQTQNNLRFSTGIVLRF